MAVGYRDKVAVNTTGGTSTLTLPSTIQAGDFLVLYAVGAYQANNPAGWSQIWFTNNAGFFQQGLLSTKVAVAGDAGASLAVSWTNNSGNYQSAAVLVFTGADHIRQFTVLNGSSGQNGPQTPASVNVAAGDALAYFGSARDTTTAPTLSRGTTDQTLSSTDGVERIVVGHELFASATTGVSQTFTAPTSGNGYADLVIEVAQSSAPALYGSLPPVDTSSWWTRNNLKSAVNGVDVLNNGSSSYAASVIETDATTYTWPGLTITAEVSANGGADTMDIGFLDAAQASTYNSNGVSSNSTFTGVSIDLYNSRTVIYSAGQTSQTLAGNLGSANTSTFDTWQVTYTPSGANVVINAVRNGTNLGSWTFTKPTFTAVKLAFGARSGAVTATFQLRGVSAGKIGSDAFIQAAPMTDGTGYTGIDTTGYTTEASEPGTLTNTAWATFTPQRTTTYQIDTIGSSFDTGLNLYTGTALGSLTLVASDDDSGGSGTSKIITTLTGGTTYYIQAGTARGAAGTLNLKAALSNAYNAAVLADTPLLYWSLDDLSGNTSVKDLSGNSRAGTINTGWNLDQPSQFIGSLAGTTSVTNGFIRSPSFAWPAGTISVEWWQVFGPTSLYMTWSWGTNYLDLINNNPTNTVGLNNNAVTYYGIGTPSAGLHHVVWVFTQGTALSPSTMKVYVDGVVQPTTYGGTAFTPATLGTTFFQVSGWAANGSWYMPAGLYVDNVAVYSGELSAARVQAHYGAGVNPFSDAFAQARGAVLPLSVSMDASGFTTETSEPLTLPVSATGWAYFTPTATGVYQLDTIGSAYDTALAVYTGTSLAALTLVGSDDSSGGSGNGKLSLHLTAGTKYYIQVGTGAAGATPSTLKFNLANTTYDGTVPARADAKSSVAAAAGWLYKGRSTRTADTGSVA